MPGIFGIFDLSGISLEDGNNPRVEALQVMARKMQYEPFYSCRFYVNRKLGVYAGWVGPLRDTAHMNPLVKPEDGLTLFLSSAFQGSLFGPHENSQNRVAEGKVGMHAFDQYARLRTGLPEKIDQLVSGLLIDEKNENCLLFNDAFGIERIFFFQDAEKIVFSSEAKAILAVVPETRKFDQKGLAEFLACGATLGERSLFRYIKVLPCGSVLKLARKKSPEIRAYIDCHSFERLETLSPRDFLKSFCETFKSVVKKDLQYLSTSAVSLTGGLDSRMIMACLHSLRRTVPCYTFGSMYRETYDVQIGKKVAALCCQPHMIFVLDEHFLENFKDYLEKAVFISDGYLGFSGAAELYLNQLARSVATTRITGNYGGELVRGVRAFKSSIPKGGFLRPVLLRFVEEAINTFFSMYQLDPVSLTLFRQVPSGYGRYAIERSQVDVVLPFLDKSIVQLIYRRPINVAIDSDPSLTIIKDGHPGLLTVPTDRGLLGPEPALVRNGRRLYREAMFKLEYWTGYGMPLQMSGTSRFIRRKSLEALFTGRHKFQHFHRWLRGELAGYVKAILSDERLANLEEFFDLSRVRIMLIHHLNGNKNFTSEIDRVMTVALTDQFLLH